MKTGSASGAGGTPARRGTPARGGTPVRLSAQPTTDLNRKLPLPGRVLQGIAVVQGIFFLLPLAAPASRLLGVALALCALLAVRLVRGTPGRLMVVLTVLAVLTLVNFAFHLAASAPTFPFRIWQLAILGSYITTLLALLLSVTGLAAFSHGFTALGVVATILLIAESTIGGPNDFSSPTEPVRWIASNADSPSGPRFAPSTIVKSLYPDNPRGYFDEPDALQRRWSLLAQQGSKAELEFPPDRRGVLRISISANPGKIGWHVSLRQAPIRVDAEERYEIRFRARADSVRTIYVAVAQAHPPFRSLGMGREIRVDTTWREFSQTFRAIESDRSSQIYFEFGAEHPSVELSGIAMRAISTNRVVQAAARRELSVSYRINGQGCRGGDYTFRADSGSRRILSLGGGDTFGIGVHQGDTYSSRLESLLNESNESGNHAGHYEVINCGAPALSTAVTQRQFSTVDSVYSPNLVLLAVAPYRDTTSATLGASRSARPAFADLRSLFRVWGLLARLGQPKAALPDFSATIDEIKRLNVGARARGARLAVVLFQHRHGEDWVRLDSALTRGLVGTDIPWITLGPVLLSFGEERLMVHPSVDRHPNELAHRVSAEALRKFLSDEDLLGNALSTRAVSVDTSQKRQ